MTVAAMQSVYLEPGEIVDRWGWTFLAAPLPADVRPMSPGECFANAQRLVARSVASGRPLAYCEGFVVFEPWDPGPYHHAWCVDRRGNVVDPTWSFGPRRVYTGVAFKSWILAHYRRVHGEGFNLLGDPEIRSLSDTEFRKIAYCRI